MLTACEAIASLVHRSDGYPPYLPGELRGPRGDDGLRLSSSGVGLKPYYLGDTSALARAARPEIAARLEPLLEAGLVARCTPTDLEAGFSSASPAKHRALREARPAWPMVSMDQRVLDRAVAVQDALADRSQQRGAKIADLLIAAAAEAAGLVVLHYDHDFDLIAQVTGQPTEWILPAGAVP